VEAARVAEGLDAASARLGEVLADRTWQMRLNKLVEATDTARETSRRHSGRLPRAK
jgi:hypothetical protein